jgi:endonuclease/exonuclease/phosphatase family metal-dependent hydrolase
MRIATWNVNSFKQRVPRLLPWLDERKPDVVCLQETKLSTGDYSTPTRQRAAMELKQLEPCWRSGPWATATFPSRADACALSVYIRPATAFRDPPARRQIPANTRSSLESAAQPWLDWLSEVDRLAVIDLVLDSQQALVDLLGFVIEPATRLGSIW